MKMFPHGFRLADDEQEIQAAGAREPESFHELVRKAQWRSAPLELPLWKNARTTVGQRTLKLVAYGLIAQVFIAAFLIIQETREILGWGKPLHDFLEINLAILLLITIAGSVWALRRLMREILACDNARAVAMGLVAQLVETRFAEWDLTGAERDVALFTLKGFETQEIADMRSTAQGTVRVQLARVYEKAGVHTRCGFQSLFFDGLLEMKPGLDGQPELPLA